MLPREQPRLYPRAEYPWLRDDHQAIAAIARKIHLDRKARGAKMDWPKECETFGEVLESETDESEESDEESDEEEEPWMEEDHVDTPLEDENHLLFNQAYLMCARPEIEEMEKGLDDPSTDMIVSAYAKYFKERTCCAYHENSRYSQSYVALKLQQSIQFETDRAKGDKVVGKLRGILLYSFMFDKILRQLKKDALTHRIPGKIVKSDKKYKELMSTYPFPFGQFDEDQKKNLVEYLDDELKRDIESCLYAHFQTLPKVLGHVCFVYKLRHRLETYMRLSGIDWIVV